MVIFLSGYGQTDGQMNGQTDTVLESSLWKHINTQKVSTQSSKLRVIALDRYMDPQMPGCIITA